MSTFLTRATPTLAPSVIVAETPRLKNFNDVLRNAKKIKVDTRGGDANLDPHIEIQLKNGDTVLISVDDTRGKKIGWSYDDESYAP